MSRSKTKACLEISTAQADGILEELEAIATQVERLIISIERIKATSKKKKNSPNTLPGTPKSTAQIKKEAGKHVAGPFSPFMKGKAKRPKKPASNYEWSDFHQRWYDPEYGPPRC